MIVLIFHKRPEFSLLFEQLLSY